MTILITGIHGFVGTNLVQSLKEHHSIYGLDIVSPDKEGIVKTFGWNELDVLPPIDAVIHLARYYFYACVRANECLVKTLKCIFIG
jgi:nucleoside-diphosphate-sugar epimerase